MRVFIFFIMITLSSCSKSPNYKEDECGSYHRDEFSDNGPIIKILKVGKRSYQYAVYTDDFNWSLEHTAKIEVMDSLLEYKVPCPLIKPIRTRNYNIPKTTKNHD